VEHIRVAVVGGGQAGLSASYWLSASDIDHVVFDPAKPGESWLARWDTFTLVTPNWSLDLPGHPYDGEEPDGFLPRDAIAQYVSEFAATIRPTIVPERVLSLSRDTTWNLATDAGKWSADAVVVATGAFPHPSTPGVSAKLPDEIVQAHSQHYRNPAQLPDGAILVVGSGQSGAQIVDDLLIAGQQVWFAVGSAGVAPRMYRGRDIVAWLGEMGFFDSAATDASRHAASVMVSGRDGGKSLDLRTFGSAGVRLVGRVTDVESTSVSFAPNLEEMITASLAVGNELTKEIDSFIDEHRIDASDPDWTVEHWKPPVETSRVDLLRENITSVVWATGYHYDYSWIDGLPVDQRGYPNQTRGITDLPGLYFVGLNQMHTIASSLFKGVGHDAAYVVRTLSDRL
jgi:putative flavoprotein involved in K+ transport